MIHFNIKRFCRVLRWELALSRRSLLATFAVVSVSMVFLQALWLLLAQKSAVEVVGRAVFFALVVYLLVCGSFIFSTLRTRQQRINHFMLPAASSEKFLARYLMLVVVMPLVTVVGFFLGDVLQHLFTLVIKPSLAEWGCGSVRPLFTNFDGFSEGGYTISWPYWVVALLSFHASYLLTGSLFRKHPFVLGFVSWAVVVQLVMLLTVLTVKHVLPLFYGESFTIVFYDTVDKIIYFVLHCAFIIFCYWFAYRKYKSLQVINNKWIN